MILEGKDPQVKGKTRRQIIDQFDLGRSPSTLSRRLKEEKNDIRVAKAKKTREANLKKKREEEKEKEKKAPGSETSHKLPNRRGPRYVIVKDDTPPPPPPKPKSRPPLTREHSTTERISFFMAYDLHTKSVPELCSEKNIARTTAYNWLSKREKYDDPFDENIVRTWRKRPESGKPGRPAKVDAETCRQILNDEELQKKPRKELIEKFELDCSATTLKRRLEAEKVAITKEKRKKTRAATMARKKREAEERKALGEKDVNESGKKPSDASVKA